MREKGDLARAKSRGEVKFSVKGGCAALCVVVCKERAKSAHPQKGGNPRCKED